MKEMFSFNSEYDEELIPSYEVPYFNKEGKIIKYLSQWEDYNLPLGHCIINKTVCGCGFTHYCLTNNDNIILISPRKTLIINKVEQNPNCYYFKPKDLTNSEKKFLIKANPLVSDPEELFRQECFRRQLEELRDYLLNEIFPKKILVTNDSLPKLFIILDSIFGTNTSWISDYRVIVDEFQLIFSDAKFKASVGLNLVSSLQNFSNVTYVSATPVMKKYLNEMPEFKNLPYLRLDWGNRAIKPKIERIHASNLSQLAIEEIKTYKEGIFNYSKINSLGELITSKEVVFYVSNISMITGLIKKAKLTPEEVNIIVSDTPDNKKKIQQLGKGFRIGKAPLRGEEHKMFTFCTSTAYCGVDFYSTNARSIILSNCNLSSMAVDISLDLPQILGRQRLVEINPFALEAIFVYTTTIKNISEQDLEKHINKKISQTETIVENYSISAPTFKPILRDKLRVSIDAEKYEKDYAGIDSITGEVVFNRLVLLSEIRAWEVQNKNYDTDFSVLSTIERRGDLEVSTEYSSDYYRVLSIPTWDGKLKECCKYYAEDVNHVIFSKLPSEYKYYLDIFGISGVSRLSYKKSNLDKELKKLSEKTELISSNQDSTKIISDELKNIYSVGNRITSKELKETFRQIKEKYSLLISPKASLIKNFCEVKRARITLIPNSPPEEGFEILSFLN